MEVAADHQARHSRRLHLHIPNSHPRSTSPRSSPRGSPVLHSAVPVPESIEVETEVQDGQVTHARVTGIHPDVNPDRGSGSKIFAYFRVHNTSGESSRDFLARERTYFSWLRLSALLAVASVALYLRLRLPTIDEVSAGSLRAGKGTHIEQVFTPALARRIQRKQFELLSSQGKGFLNTSPIIGNNLYYSTLNSTSGDSALIRSPSFSKGLGSLFFILAVIALLCGHMDYMKSERALEEADKLISIGDQMREAHQQGERTLLHNASSARKAHSSHYVHAVEIVIALAVFATALLILITLTNGNIQPPSPGR